MTVKRTYVILLKNGSIKKVTVPADWKVTFGGVNPARAADTCIRMYESKDKQRAVFSQVVEFYEETEMEISVKKEGETEFRPMSANNSLGVSDSEYQKLAAIKGSIVTKAIYPEYSDSEGDVVSDVLDVHGLKP